MDNTYLFIDIETIEDPERKEMSKHDIAGGNGGKGFPPLHIHKIIMIGALMLDQRYFFKKLGIFGEGKQEQEIIEDFNKFVLERKPTIVTFNGRRFDLPVIVLRSMKYGINMQWYLGSQEYSRRYPPTRHIDLCDVLSEYGSHSFTSLDSISTVIGLRGKSRMDGSKVQEEYTKGNMEEIKNYCLCDVVMTGCVFLRYQFISGVIQPELYNEAIESMAGGIEKDGRLKDYLDPEEIRSLKVILS